MNDYLSIRGTRDFARVSPEELNRVQIARNGYHLKTRGMNAQLGELIRRYLCDGLKSRCWDCECLVQCEYGKRTWRCCASGRRTRDGPGWATRRP